MPLQLRFVDRNVFILSHQIMTFALGFSVMLCSPELRTGVHTAVPFLWQLAAVDPIREFAPFRTVIALCPVLIRSLPEDMWRQASEHSDNKVKK